MKHAILTMMKVIFLGAPGVGKGTVAAKCAAHYGVAHISTGDIFRTHIKQQTELGRKVSAILREGGLVPDALTIALVKDRLGEDGLEAGYILDGFPRTLDQAEALGTFSTVDTAILFELARDKIVERLSGRRIHKASGRIYHIAFNPPKTAGIDDVTGDPLAQRPDDRKEAILNRLAVYEKETAPLIAYYQAKHMLVTIDATPAPTAVFAAVQTLLPS